MEIEEIHGAVSVKEDWKHCRWCSIHEHYHGSLYPCPHYDEEALSEINRQADTLRQNLSDKDWVLEQIRHGVSPEGIEIMRFFVG